MASTQGLLERLSAGQTVICAVGIRSELERRGLVWADESGRLSGTLGIEEHLRMVFEDFIHCGSDVVMLGCFNEKDPGGYPFVPESMEVAREVADKSKTLLGASVRPPSFNAPDSNQNTHTFHDHIKAQVDIAMEAEADFIMTEDFTELGQAKSALEVIKQYGKGVPAVMTLSGACHKETSDGVPLGQALRVLEESGADVVGLGCSASPATIIAALREARKICKGPLAGLPDAYRYVTDDGYMACTRKDVRAFSQQTREEVGGVQFVGLCCGGIPSGLREIADDHARQTPASRFSPDIAKCCMYLSNPTPSQAKRKLHQITKDWREYEASCLGQK